MKVKAIDILDESSSTLYSLEDIEQLKYSLSQMEGLLASAVEAKKQGNDKLAHEDLEVLFSDAKMFLKNLAKMVDMSAFIDLGASNSF